MRNKKPKKKGGLPVLLYQDESSSFLSQDLGPHSRRERKYSTVEKHGAKDALEN